MGGENSASIAAELTTNGSSPRGRGKRHHLSRDRIRLRLIPAWAGKTKPLPIAVNGLTAHPRVGGENVLEEIGGDVERGSSPRGRGKRRRSPPSARLSRLIPAWAGKTIYISGCSRIYQAHPRVGGENRDDDIRVGHEVGSSPRGRGKLRSRRLAAMSFGLIPAWAGKTVGRGRGRAERGAHPRVGGENVLEEIGGDVERGSSPRGRGKPGCTMRRARCIGLIPAWAGKTRRYVPARPQRTAHPRVGGENPNSTASAWRASGSSPRGRGKLIGVPIREGISRLIPAWAGKTNVSSVRALAAAAHPRVGGENSGDRLSPGRAAGSSPRGRGKLSVRS